MLTIKKNDLVSVIVGKNKGKRGKVLRVFPKTSRAIVEGVNLVKRHTRKRREDEQGGIIQREGPINISNLMLYCSKCNRPARTGFRTLRDKNKVRFCRKCNEAL